MMAPILSFTAEEAWRFVSGDAEDSVFLHTWHRCPVPADASVLIERWTALRAVRTEVQKELERSRTAGAIGSSLQAEVVIKVDGAKHDLLARLGDHLKFVLITSQATLEPANAEAIVVTPSAQAKCGRCWHYRADVGHDPAHPTLCGRCTSNLFGAGEDRPFA